ncbi:MAG: Ribosomal protein [Patescibacteria group bacterium]|jgi:large subunit ribosomal protein L33|nr:Ribosomal protein [Patescibacteria group bacterium]
MAKKGNRTWVWMVPKDKKESSYRFQTERNKVNIEGKLEMRRFDPTVRKHVLFVETK